MVGEPELERQSLGERAACTRQGAGGSSGVMLECGTMFESRRETPMSDWLARMLSVLLTCSAMTRVAVGGDKTQRQRQHEHEQATWGNTRGILSQL